MGLLRRFGLDGSDTSDSDDERDQQNLDRNAAGASKALRKIVKNSGKPGVATSGAGALGAADRIRHSAQETSWIKRLIPQLEEETAVSSTASASGIWTVLLICRLPDCFIPSASLPGRHHRLRSPTPRERHPNRRSSSETMSLSTGGPARRSSSPCPSMSASG